MTAKTLGVISFTGLFCLGAALPAWSQESEQGGVRVLEPERRQAAEVAAIDTERFELGFYTGLLSVEDFGTDPVYGIELTYHLLDDWILQANYGQANIDRAAFESSRRQFLAGKDRDFEYFSLSGGYRLVHGRSFLGARNKYDSDIYLLFGPDRVSFAGNDEWDWTFGLSYRTVFTDWLTANVDIREHSFDREFIGDSKQTFNTEFRIGVNALF